MDLKDLGTTYLVDMMLVHDLIEASVEIIQKIDNLNKTAICTLFRGPLEDLPKGVSIFGGYTTSEAENVHSLPDFF